MNKPLLVKHLGTLLSLVLVLSLNGCAFLEQFTVPGEDPEDEGGPVASVPQPDQPPYPYYPGEPTTAIYHTVKKGESLFEIAEMYGRGFRDVAAWNNLRPPYVIYPDQRLLVSTPPAEFTPEPVTAPVASVQPIQAAPLPTSGTTYHTVQRGDTLYKIATRYGQSFEQVALWNNLAPPYTISIGQSLLVSPPIGSASPVAAMPSPPPSPTTSFAPSPVVSAPISTPVMGSNVHVVQRGDTLYNISRRYNIGVQQLASLNGLAPPYPLSIGQTLQVSAGGGGMLATTPAPAASSGATYHTVARGDTLYSLSRRYGYGVDQLANWNNLSAPYNLSLGQTLQVSPGGVSASGFRTYTVDARTFLNAPATPQSAGVRDTRFHVVRRGESLASIAQRYNMTTHELSIWNGIGKPYTVYPGQRLLILSP